MAGGIDIDAQTAAGRKLRLDVEKLMKTFEKEQKREVEEILKSIGQEESRNMKSRLNNLSGSMGAKVAATIASRMVDYNGDYKELEIGSIKGEAIGSRGANLAIILAEGKGRGSEVRMPPRESGIWFFGNSPSSSYGGFVTPKSLAHPVSVIKKAYRSPAKEPEPKFLEQGMENIERKIQERVIEGIIEGWDKTAKKWNRKSGLQEFQRYLSGVKQSAGSSKYTAGGGSQ